MASKDGIRELIPATASSQPRVEVVLLPGSLTLALTTQLGPGVAGRTF